LPSEEVYKEAKWLLEAWKLVVFPTETIYGLGADARNDRAVLSIFQLKWRPQDNPLITHLWYKEQISDYATVENEIQQTIIDKLMPGPLTLLLKKKEWTISNRSCPLDYVWIRLPSNLVAQRFLQVAELPVAAPSANISWKPSPTNAKMVYDNLHDNVPLIIDDWESFAGIESTVMRVVPDEEAGKWKLKIQILRPWFLTKEDLEDCFNHKIKVEYTTKNPELSPWMRYKHYSISWHVRIFDKLSDIPTLSKEFSSKDTKIWILLTQELIDNNLKTIEKYSDNWITIIPRWTKSNLASCAHSLFDHYHTAEKSWINLLFVEKLPEEWIGYGIMNRVKRSAEV
jgi:L-threonylcarbamoyladenylate synthase